VLIALGVFVLAIAVFLMVEGSILGARTTGVATLLGMVDDVGKSREILEEDLSNC
jgi:uncharacterized membrane protein YjjP (DUF1212 family)